MAKHSDLDINCSVRRVLVRHWIDLGKLSLRTTRGVIWLSGTVEKLAHAGELTPKNMTEVTNEIKRVPDVRRVNANFTNWAESGGTWQQTARKNSRQSGSRSGGSSKSHGTVDLRDYEHTDK